MVIAMLGGGALIRQVARVMGLSKGLVESWSRGVKVNSSKLRVNVDTEPSTVYT